MSLNSFLRVICNGGKTCPWKSTFDPKSCTTLLTPSFSTLNQRNSSTVGPIFAEYHRKRKKEWDQLKKSKAEKGQNKDKTAPLKKEGAAAAAPSPSAGGARLPANNILFTVPELVPTTYWGHRDSVREALERVDLAKRRAILKIPEFYVGSLMSVTVADELSPTKQTKFVGICITKAEPGLRHRFTLRNVIDDQGLEIMYELYNPMIRDITVLKLEKRLDDELIYLRDAPDEYSTVPFDMKPIPRAAHEPVPINEIKVKLKHKTTKRDWSQKWERTNFKGIDESSIMSCLSEEERAQRIEPVRNRMWEKYDLALQYRNSVSREETDAIYKEMTARLDKEVDLDSVPVEERPIITRKKARRVGGS